MSLVVFPFKVEDPEVVVRNFEIAASHPSVQQVLGVGVEKESTWGALENAVPRISRESATAVDLVLQDRLGSLRPGKGDGMNSALRYFLDQTDLERIHFYDADITSFGEDWITRAEEAADFGYDVVRHYFPRARTDAMITWMITRSGFAMLWPRSVLSWIGQPLGGELLFSRQAAELFASDPRVVRQSDWGIDTLYTFVTAQNGLSTYETNTPQGKAHKLYGKLTDIRTMLVECFSAIQSLKDETIPESSVYRAEPADAVPKSIAERLAYAVEGTLGLISQDWSEAQENYLQLFPAEIRDGTIANRKTPTFRFMDEHRWFDTYQVCLKHFVKGDEDWEELLFKLWTIRVLQYTTTSAICGYDFSKNYLNQATALYRKKGLKLEESPAAAS